MSLNESELVSDTTKPAPAVTVIQPTERVRVPDWFPAVPVRRALPPGQGMSIEITYPCRVRHTAGKSCDCGKVVVRNQQAHELLSDPLFHMLSSLKGVPRGTLTQKDMDFLAFRVSIIVGHWARLALGQADLT